MPTPAVDETPSPPLHQLLGSIIHHRSVRATCPPEDDRLTDSPPRSSSIDALIDGPTSIDNSPAQGAVHVEVSDLTTPPLSISRPTSQQDSETDGESSPASPSPIPVGRASKSEAFASPVTWPVAPSSTLAQQPLGNFSIPERRCPPRYSSSYLKAGSIFEGTQQSDRQVYNVQVEIKYVDMSESFVCGYLRIEGLTSEHPTLTTYFEGEIIGTKYSFLTNHSEWGSNEKVDMQHWNRFPAWKPLQRQARKPDFNFKTFADREHLFMRWKEYFLVPDHKVRTISGASFEGFYYICFDQVKGGVSGIYFHSKSEKFQQLELKHVSDRGCTGAMEFR